MTDQHTADTSYEQQYEMHGNGEFHHPAPLHAEPAATYGIKPPSSSPPRPARRLWPLGALLTVGVLVICLAGGIVASLIAVNKVSARASQATQLASSEAASLASMGRQLAAVQAKVAAPAKVYRPPAIYQHYGICLVRTTDNATGDLANITLVTPVVNGGSYSCPHGNLISVVPGG